MNKKTIVIAISTIMLSATLGVFYFTNKSKITAEPIPQKDTTVAQVTSNKCIITIDGKKYNVTEFRKLHEGGDIFDCGEDNTEKFYSEHTGGKLEQMGTYLID